MPSLPFPHVESAWLFPFSKDIIIKRLLCVDALYTCSLCLHNSPLWYLYAHLAEEKLRFRERK